MTDKTGLVRLQQHAALSFWGLDLVASHSVWSVSFHGSDAAIDFSLTMVPRAHTFMPVGSKSVFCLPGHRVPVLKI